MLRPQVPFLTRHSGRWRGGNAPQSWRQKVDGRNSFDVTRAGCFSGMFFSTATTIPSILIWLTMFIDLVIYLFVMNGSLTVSNAFSFFVCQDDRWFPSFIVSIRCFPKLKVSVGPILQSWERSHTALCKMFLDLVCRYGVEGVCITIYDSYGSVAFW